MLKLLGKLLLSVASGLLAKMLRELIETSVKKLPLPNPLARLRAIRLYKGKLKNTLTQMPFIYAGLDLDILEDYVSPDLCKVSTKSLDTKEELQGGGLEEFLKSSQYLALVGPAGVGKTTFMRRNALQISHRQSKFLKRQDRLLPIFVPLKLVSPQSVSGIYDYILAQDPFNGDSEFLCDTTADRGLFLFLDGYDEIAVTSGRQPQQYEISQFLFAGSREFPWPTGRFYRALEIRSRVWVSSRRDFLLSHALWESHDNRHISNTSVRAAGIKGIGANRKSLVDRIFKRYPSGKHLLDSDLFLQLIDAANDTEVSDVSFNPLFLTMMCYNYAQAVMKAGRSEIALGPTLEALILDCVNLLLIDLDEYKARKLPKPRAEEAISCLHRVVETKRKFLRYLAANAYLTHQSFFTEQSLRNDLSAFLETQTRSGEKERHNEGHRHPDDLITQLIYCGLLPQIPMSSHHRAFDFPHRRFREVLASSYFSSPIEYMELLQSIRVTRQSAFSELLSVLKRSPQFNREDLHVATLDLIADQMLIGERDDRDVVEITEAFVKLAPVSIDLSRSIAKLVFRAIQTREPAFVASKALLSKLHAKLDDVANIKKCLLERLRANDLNCFTLTLDLLESLDPKGLQILITTLMEDQSLNSHVAAYLLRAAARTKMKNVVDMLLHQMRRQIDLAPFFNLLMIEPEYRSEEVMLQAWSSLGLAARAEMLVHACLLVEGKMLKSAEFERLLLLVDSGYSSAEVRATQLGRGAFLVDENCVQLLRSTLEGSLLNLGAEAENVVDRDTKTDRDTEIQAAGSRLEDELKRLVGRPLGDSQQIFSAICQALNCVDWNSARIADNPVRARLVRDPLEKQLLKAAKSASTVAIGRLEHLFFAWSTYFNSGTTSHSLQWQTAFFV